MINKLDNEKRSKIIQMLVEGNSMRSTSRIAECSINTVTSLLVSIGKACKIYQDAKMKHLDCKYIQCDEIWAFCGMKEKRVPAEIKGVLGIGDVYTWTALDANSKLIISYLVGKRDAGYAKIFIDDLASRIANKVQLTTDGHRAYLQAIDDAFNGNIDYAMLVKLYGEESHNNKKYSPACCIGARKDVISGSPDLEKVSTSYVERQNLTMRMSMRRFTRLTNAFSKKIENLEHAVSLYFMYYNFARVHKSLDKQTPAMRAGLSDHVWSIEEIIKLTDDKELMKKTCDEKNECDNMLDGDCTNVIGENFVNQNLN